MAKKVYVGIGDVARNVKKSYIGVDGVARKVKKAYIGVNGIARQFWGDFVLGNCAEGEIVYLQEKGVWTPFYVAKHDYEPDLNGKGRTLLVRKDAYKESTHIDNTWYRDGWSSDTDNEYSYSKIDSVLNDSYKKRHTSVVQSAMGQTKFYFTQKDPALYGYDNVDKIGTLSRSVFILSVTEFGFTNASANGLALVEGSALPIANLIRITNFVNDEGAIVTQQWTRTPYLSNAGTHNVFTVYGNNCGGLGAENQCPRRPAFTLPSDTIFDVDTKYFVSVPT